MAFAPLDPPKSFLGVHRQLAPTAGVKVSPLCFGGMSLGTKWGSILGPVDKETSFKLLDRFYEHGGNFIDTACNYQNGESESIIGEWMTARNNRDQIVLATKYTTAYRGPEGSSIIQSNFGGMHTKSLKHTLKSSLEKLQTDYLDVLYIHWWDYGTKIPEVMRALDDVVRKGLVLYLGVSDTPAWIVAKANQYARDHSLTPFVVYQGHWNAGKRDFERDIIPMTRDEGMALAPWGVLGGGAFKSKATREKGAQEGRKKPPTEAQIKISDVMEDIAGRKGDGVSLTSIALAYVMHKTPYVFPIVGGRTLEQLQGNIDALAVELSTEEIREIENAGSFEWGFPSEMYIREGQPRDISGCFQVSDSWLNKMHGSFADVKMEQAIRPSEVFGMLAKD